MYSQNSPLEYFAPGYSRSGSDFLDYNQVQIVTVGVRTYTYLRIRMRMHMHMRVEACKDWCTLKVLHAGSLYNVYSYCQHQDRSLYYMSYWTQINIVYVARALQLFHRHCSWHVRMSTSSAHTRLTCYSATPGL